MLKTSDSGVSQSTGLSTDSFLTPPFTEHPENVDSGASFLGKDHDSTSSDLEEVSTDLPTVRDRHAPKKYTPPLPARSKAHAKPLATSDFGPKRFRVDEHKKDQDHELSPVSKQIIEFTLMRNKTEKNHEELVEFVNKGIEATKPAAAVSAFTESEPPPLTAADILPVIQKGSVGRPRIEREVKKGKDRKKPVQPSDKEREFLKSDFKDGAKIRSLSAKYHISIATASKIAHETHPPSRRGGPTVLKMTPAVSQYLSETLNKSPTTSTKTLAQGIKETFGMEVHRSTIDKHITSRKMTEHGLEPFSFTKVYTHEFARNSEETKAERRVHVQMYRSLKNSGQDYLFTDESGFALTTYADRGWSPRGERTVIRRRRYRVQNISGIVMGSTRFGIVHCVWTVGSVDKTLYQAFLVEAIQHYQKDLNPKGATYMHDNVKFHCDEDVLNYLTKNGYNVLQAARYSPELMPMELIFAIIKARVVIDPSYTRPDEIIPCLMKAVRSITVEEFNACVAHVETHMHPRVMANDDLNLRDSLAGFRADKKLIGPEKAAAVHNPKGSPLLKKYRKAKTATEAAPATTVPFPIESTASNPPVPAEVGTMAGVKKETKIAVAPNATIGEDANIATSHVDTPRKRSPAFSSPSVDSMVNSNDEFFELPSSPMKRSREGVPTSVGSADSAIIVDFKSPVQFVSSAQFFQGVTHNPLPDFKLMIRRLRFWMGEASGLGNNCLYECMILNLLGRVTDLETMSRLIPMVRNLIADRMTQPAVFQVLLPFFLDSSTFLQAHIAGVRGGEMGTALEFLQWLLMTDRAGIVYCDDSARPLTFNEAAAAHPPPHLVVLAHINGNHFIPLWPLDGEPFIGMGPAPLIRLRADGTLEFNN